MVLPLRVQPLDTWVDPADAFVALYGASDVDAAWLDSGPEAVDGRSFIGTGTLSATSSVAGGTVTVAGVTSPGDILDALREDLTARRHPEPSGHPIGWWGRLGYEAGAAAAGAPVALPAAASPGTKPPVDAAFLLVDRLLAFEHASRSVVIVAPDDAAGRAWSDEVVRTLGSPAIRDSARLYESARPVPAATARWRHDDTAYLAAIDACRAAIRAGDAYQLCLTNQASAHTGADPLAVHLRLRRASPAPYGGFVRIAGESLVSSSPEEFLRMDAHRRVRTRPIKGTRPRGATVAADLELRAELEASEKERAENVMIVDLMRNDLGRVCEVGSVEVSHLLAVESYAQVHQLVSTVEGRLRAGLTAMDAVAACFPAGSMTGAPKLSAMRILHRLENGPRGAFAGCFGYLALDGTADLAMVIRSIHFADGVATIGAGGGITALSVPSEELEEVRVKARALFAAAGLAS
ncbi:MULTISPECIES: anthranilate synthase component I family protein [unclassified Leifsonia]|uniref:anthranilate synthase component I family protein n=1 Tax=unclassified Leifsonia TaxID=2663824 RepID=UPI0008A78DF2|nr:MULTISPECIES: anthranilate synthase component I family protein [unclassified Leifsonia]SEH86544.1 anthranilate synthase component 1 [Leifsonia sp. CL154]SFL48976.1 anthranilate synthase component 1 [Leifsonia sp. CL147]